MFKINHADSMFMLINHIDTLKGYFLFYFFGRCFSAGEKVELEEALSKRAEKQGRTSAPVLFLSTLFLMNKTGVADLFFTVFLILLFAAVAQGGWITSIKKEKKALSSGLKL